MTRQQQPPSPQGPFLKPASLPHQQQIMAYTRPFWDDIPESEIINYEGKPNHSSDQQVLRSFANYEVCGPSRRLHIRPRPPWRDGELALYQSALQVATWSTHCRFHGITNDPEHAALCPLTRKKIILRRINSNPVTRDYLAGTTNYPYPQIVHPLYIRNPLLKKPIVPESVEVVIAEIASPPGRGEMSL